MCSQGWDFAKKPVALLCTQLKWFSFKFAQEFIIHLFFSPDLVLYSYLGAHFQLFLPSFSAQWSLGKGR